MLLNGHFNELDNCEYFI